VNLRGALVLGRDSARGKSGSREDGAAALDRPARLAHAMRS
ncbi:unnamed protein product, partial [Acidocella sp. C78]